jgi:hypothetical protein
MGRGTHLRKVQERAGGAGRRGGGPIIGAAYGLAFLGSAVLGARVLSDALLDARLEAAVTRDRGGRADLPWQAPVQGDPCSAACPPRALAASGVHLIIAAGGPTDPTGARLPDAQRRLEQALARRPGEGGWLTWLAYVKARREGVTPAVLGAYAASYKAAPYLAREGFWRVRFGALNWARLPIAVRRRMIAEAVWLKAIDPNGDDPALDPATDPQVVRAIAVALAQPVEGLVPHRRSRSPGSIGPVGE